MTTTPAIRACSLADLQSKGCVVVNGPDRPVAVFWNGGKPRAVDNRCPHMGFPLAQGTVADGILTCHWHHARFDLASGCTFDLFADDVPACGAEVRGEDVWLTGGFGRADEAGYWRRRLRDGMTQGVALVTAKAILGLRAAGAGDRAIVAETGLHGVRHRDGWGAGLTTLTGLANLLEGLPEEDAVVALCQGARRVADDCFGQSPRIDRGPLEGSAADLPTLAGWFRGWIRARHRDGAERTLLTAAANGAKPAEIAAILFTAVTDRAYAGGGHALDFANKALELLDRVGWDHAAAILPSVIDQMASARGGEEDGAWRQPDDLIALTQDALNGLPGALREGDGRTFESGEALVGALLHEEPGAGVDALTGAFRDGASPREAARRLAYAAALRIGRFGTANEFGDWVTALHTFTYCHAMLRVVERCGGPEGRGAPVEILRGLYHGAVSVYLDRFLNVPPVHLPTIGGRNGASPNPEKFRTQFLGLLDRAGSVEEAAALVAHYLDGGGARPPMVAALVFAATREDADFHTIQMVEAAVRLAADLGETHEARNVLVAAARYLAAHAPTQRSQLQTVQIALRLHRGESLHA